MSENIPDLTIELLDRESGLIIVQQDSGGNLDRVALHPLHVRHLAEKFGLVASSDPASARHIATLSRRLRLLRERVDELDTMLLHLAEKGRECLDEEIAFSRATLDIANEFCADLGPSVSELSTTAAADQVPPSQPAPSQATLDLAHSYFTIP